MVVTSALSGSAAASGIWRCGACDEVRDMEIVNLALDRLHKERLARADAVAQCHNRAMA